MFVDCSVLEFECLYFRRFLSFSNDFAATLEATLTHA